MKPEEKFVQIRIETTSGEWPEAPKFEEVPENQPVSVLLKKAAKELGLADTTNWVLRYGNKTLDTNTTWAKLGLSGLQIELDWGPNAGGGGNA